MLTAVDIEKMERGGVDDPINCNRSAKIISMSTIGASAVMNDSVVLIFSGVGVDLYVRNKELVTILAFFSCLYYCRMSFNDHRLYKLDTRPSNDQYGDGSNPLPP